MYKFTAARKAALRKAQAASARARRKGRSINKRKAVSTTAAVLATGGLFAYTMKMGKGSNRHPSVAVPTMSRNASAARPTGPGMLTRSVKGIGMARRPGRASRINQSRTKDALSPYYQSRMNRGRNVLVRGMKQAPPLRKKSIIFSTNSDGVTSLRSKRTVKNVTRTVPIVNGIGYPRNKRQQKAYNAQRAYVSQFSGLRAIPPRSTVQY